MFRPAIKTSVEGLLFISGVPSAQLQVQLQPKTLSKSVMASLGSNPESIFTSINLSKNSVLFILSSVSIFSALEQSE